jgi:hypothetical protein
MAQNLVENDPLRDPEIGDNFGFVWGFWIDPRTPLFSRLL